MATIAPNPTDLGITSIQLGTWFSDSGISLPLPDTDNLGVNINSATDWLPPANGVLSLILPKTVDFNGETLFHKHLVKFKKADGTPQFGDIPGKMVALFTLLPEVHIRLRQLYINEPNLGNTTANSPTRPVPMYFAMMVDTPANVSGLSTMMDDTISNEDDVKALGLTGTGPFENGDVPMGWLRRPQSGSDQEFLIKVPASGGELFVYDEEGFPIDPGAVAEAFEALTTEFDNLWGGAGAASFPNRTAGKSIHLMGLAQGNLDNDIRDTLRLNGGGAAPTDLVTTGTDATVSIAFDATASSERPFLRHALLPASPFQTSTTVAAANLFDRDYLRVAVGDVEQWLTGKSSQPAYTEANGNFQGRASTKVNIAANTAANILLPNHEAVITQAHALLDNPDPAIVVSGQINGTTGPITAPALPDVSVPGSIDAIQLLTLEGGQGPDDSAHPGWAKAMEAVLQVDLDSSLANAWVRALPLGFSLATGSRSQMPGGGGLAIATDGVARATMVVTLPPDMATVDPDDVVAFDVEIVTSRGKILLGTQKTARINRPAATSAAIDIDSATFPTGVDAIYVCETGQRITSGGTFNLPSGRTLIAELSGGGFAKVNLADTPYNVFNNGTGTRLTNADTLVTTDRVWKKAPEGDSDTQLTSTNATLDNTGRSGLDNLIAPGVPLPLQERKELVVSTAADGNARALIGALPLTDGYHDLSPTLRGLAGQKVGEDTHATGARLEGPAGVLALEFALDRRHKETTDLLDSVIDDNHPDAPTNPTGAQPLTAVLRTVAAQVEGEIQFHIDRTPDLLNNIEDYDYTDSLADKRTLINGITPLILDLPDLPDASETAKRTRMERYLDRRVRGATKGYAETGDALAYLLGQARHFVYIETSNFDVGLGLDGADGLRLIQTIKSALDSNPGLHVALCVPLKTGHPFDGVKRLFDNTRQSAFQTLKPKPNDTSAIDGKPWSAPAHERIAIFSPYGPGYRPHFIQSTTVIVDDAVAITGAFELTLRGLTFDSSLAAAVFDERLQNGKSQEVFPFRQQLIADRLRVDPAFVPEQGGDVVRYLNQIVKAGNNQSIQAPKAPKQGVPDAADGSPDPVAFGTKIFNPDGRRDQGNFNLADYLVGLIADAGIRDELA